ncbi:MAG: bile acid:sodium symporter family protein [Methylicorpusculum sp.]|uniref:bile acid:sodium symporter family protein n=2 Tax=Methylicorpusculum sp. TaxID=2713644 RepID=UPI00271EE97D|nr:bile acid:sodium symporter family protein [Methylicorpusculum sp.]MDO8843763.1 bile acid:sodium symporter family protein [Methylicorpusculum sp.]MDO8939615.1 bile acid:sodium symporter family protein [Methylicorpusculum sp.]MDP2180630.1 bile acid:sodium symporter family protein [Methylicorpusculum sp.]MDP2203671.1 bile acid:sodium symporter family protein [Methylicorpusculum sp.]MDP3530451.1 bile acid:sodium symporter family protein [Methylicorpusculum sp.]
MISRLVNLFPLWAAILACAAYFYPGLFISGKQMIVPLLSLIMFTMGLTLTWSHFQDTLKYPGIILLTMAIQFTVMPLLAWLLSGSFSLTNDQSAGMILVGCSAGGTASNVICYLARGNVALSILMTLSSTVAAVFITPLLTLVLMDQSISPPFSDMMKSLIELIIIPVMLGTMLNTFFQNRISAIHHFLPLMASLAIVAIIAVIVSLNQQQIEDMGSTLLAAVALHNLGGMLAGYAIPWLLRYDKQTCRTASIEVGMQNSGLSVALAITYFSSAAALPGAIFSIWHNLSGSFAAMIWRKYDV